MKLGIKKIIVIGTVFVLTLVVGITPNIAYAERIPFAIQNVTQSIPLRGLEESFQIAPQGFPVNVPGLNYTVSAPVPEEARTH
jgi:hypothetical protein